MSNHPRQFIQKLVPKWKLLKRTEPEKYGTGMVGLAKNAWGECSEVVVALGIAVFSGVAWYRNYLRNCETGYNRNKPYKHYYTVYRPDDPKILKLREEWFETGGPTITSSRIGLQQTQ